MDNTHKLGKTKRERREIFEDIKHLIEEGYSLQEISEKYGVSRQAISLKMNKEGFPVKQELRRIKAERITKHINETAKNNADKIAKEIKYYKIYNCTLRKEIDKLKKELKFYKTIVEKFINDMENN